MEKSLFFKWLATRFSAVITSFSETLNGKDGDEPKYLFKQYLGKVFSLDLTWASLNGNGRSVAADVVALDASVPLKRRASISTVKGDVPKIGMKKRKSEREMQDLQTLQATNQNGSRTSQILAKLFNDPLAVTRGVYERLEYMFLEGLSTGFTETNDDNNEGVSIRIDYGVVDKNVAIIKWTNPSSNPINDLTALIDARSANGYGSTYMFMDRFAFNNFRNKQSVKDLYSASIGYNGANAPTPNLEQVNNALTNNGMPQIIMIDRSVNIEKNGIITAVKPWATGAVVITDTLDLGDVVWSDLVEKNNPSKEVLYASADDYILVSTWHTNDPFSELVSSQALALPVINNVNGITILDSDNSEGPDVDAGADKTATGASTTQTGTATGKNGRSISSQLWTVVSFPAGATVSLTNDTNLTVNIAGITLNGEYVLQLAATDEDGNVSADQVTITRSNV